MAHNLADGPVCRKAQSALNRLRSTNCVRLSPPHRPADNPVLYSRFFAVVAPSDGVAMLPYLSPPQIALMSGALARLRQAISAAFAPCRVRLEKGF